MKHLLWSGLALASIALFATPSLAEDDFGCAGYEFSAALPAIEGDEGTFFRTFADLRLQHPMDQRTMSLMAQLSKTLKAGGTTLIYVTIPSKSQGMPGLLPARAKDYGFDPAIAQIVYTDIITRLTAAGITAPDIMTALRAAKPDERVFFGADFHWTSTGARLAAQAIGAEIKADPSYADLTPAQYVSTPTGVETAFSGMRRALQGFCKSALPPTDTMTYQTTKVEDASAGGSDVSIFADAAGTVPVVLVGTSFSDSPINNFDGFLAEFTGLEIVNYAITGGNQYGAMTSYLTSDEFHDQRPRFLIWENPIYNNLAQYGSAPLDELIAAAGSNCTKTLEVRKIDATTLSASLDGVAFGPQDAVHVDFGAEGARKVDFSFDTADGITRSAKIERSARLRATGHFYLGMGALRQLNYTTMQVHFDRPVTDDTTLSLCLNTKGDAS